MYRPSTSPHQHGQGPGVGLYAIVHDTGFQQTSAQHPGATDTLKKQPGGRVFRLPQMIGTTCGVQPPGSATKPQPVSN